ncbi:DeoR/GlpR transcriptional regulator [Actinoplanes sp. TBRC 11911]|uniref:DeoR/GlpR family DNA-binding transcription regulator n=1 Tax=Actinoplanes sp. TBRC 11911 TaxID=2729386 RepID=UPI00145D48BE|nr:DeoR/GlpR family DNA-binding transcription regulator [Actinoplanes sp. TBRC 11911]NMO54554.1 DeoR/GlpR transcriptional regulator [Actinoplanes sp. TBRC 11911]
MQRKERLRQMVAAIVGQGGVEVETLAKLFSVSAATVRRDLEVLEKQRLVTRTRGGATTHASFNDLPLSYKTEQDTLEKRHIAREALKFLADARVIGTTGGTTVSEFARLLMDRDGLTIVTNALNVATFLVANPRLRVFSAGGEVRSSSQETVGPTAESFMAGYNIDVAFIGVDGVDAAAGCTNYDPVGARVNAVLREQARVSVVLADASKIGRVALAQVCKMSDVDVLVTDSRASEIALASIRAQGCQVLTV